VSSAALGLTLASAFVHAAWNLALARARDAEAAMAVVLVLALGVWALPAALLGGVSAAAAPYIAASAVLELAYFALLAAAYRRAELSVVYPVARGAAPVLLVVAAAAGLGGAVGAAQVAGVVLIAGGIVAVRGPRGGGDVAARDLALAVGVGACIAAYTLVDREGVRHAAPVPYLWLVLVGPAVVYAGAMARLKGAPALRAELTPGAGLAAVGILGAFALALAALREAPAAAVGAVRETSVVIAVAAAGLLLGERVGARRLAGATVVVAGIAFVALG
jgi:drug/metabolite transporter (DMT)-like permease